MDSRCESARNGLGVTDFDLMLHRFKRVYQGRVYRDIEHLMVVEIKQTGERLGSAQRDSLSTFNAALDLMIPVDGRPLSIESRPGHIVPGGKKIMWHGVHLLRVPVRESTTGPFFWDNRLIDCIRLRDVLNFEYDPRNPSRRLDVDRRHKPQKRGLPLFTGP